MHPDTYKYKYLYIFIYIYIYTTPVYRVSLYIVNSLK